MAQGNADIKKYIGRKLGFPVVANSLTDEMLDDAIQDASEWFSGYSGQILYTIDTIPGTRELSVPDNCEQVVEVIFQGDSNISDYFAWADVEMNPLDYGWSYGGIQDGFLSTYTQLIQYLDMSRRVFGSERTWEWIQTSRTVKLFPNSSGDVGSRVLIAYLTNDLNLELMYPFQYRILRKYAYAEAMETLSHIRGKYASGPSATGELMLDGDSLAGAAGALKEKMEEKLKTMRQPLGFLVG